MNISVLGCGRWGTFIAYYLADSHNVTLWGRQGSKKLETLKTERKNEYLTLKANIKLTNSLDEAMQNDIIIISILTQSLRDLLKDLKKYDLTNKKICFCMKGIESSTGETLTQIAIENGVPKNNLALWVGPGHVQNFINGVPNCMIITAYNVELSKHLVNIFSSNLIRFYIGKDVIGAEIGSAFKNVLGIAAGILDGLNLSCLKGALMARGTYEVSKLVEACGGNKMTPYGLSHLGDFEATLFSQFSNNRMYGENFIKGIKNEKSAEGVGNILGILKLAKDHNLEMPTTEALYNILYLNMPAKTELDKIFNRELKFEFDD